VTPAVAAPLVLGVVAASFNRSVAACLERVAAIIDDAREQGVRLLVLPDAALGGYLSSLGGSPSTEAVADAPPSLSLDGPEVAQVIRWAQDMVVCVGLRERDGQHRYNSAVCLHGDGVLGVHRKVHLPPHDRDAYRAGDRFDAIDTPVGRIGMLVDYDKTFPEGARSLSLQGASILACLNAWPASVTVRATRLDQDPQARLTELYDRARAAENQVVWASANQSGRFGNLRFLGQARVVGPGGNVLAATGTKPGLATCSLDLHGELARARARLHHLAERQPDAYGPAR
jgi:predicted amidohydrolase